MKIYAIITLFVIVQNNRNVMPVYIGVNDIGIHIITVDTKVCAIIYVRKSLIV